MHEKPRFAIALAGVGGCLCIAAGIVISVPRESALPSVNGLPAPRAERLPRLPMPSWSDVAAPVASATAARPESSVQEAHVRAHVDAPRVEALIAAPAVINRQSSPRESSGTPSAIEGSIVNRQFPVPVLLTNPPSAGGKSVAETGGRDRGPVAGALVTAGTHIGGGFRTVGRTLKRVF
jgi:hypothetical protein